MKRAINYLGLAVAVSLILACKLSFAADGLAKVVKGFEIAKEMPAKSVQEVQVLDKGKSEVIATKNAIEEAMKTVTLEKITTGTKEAIAPVKPLLPIDVKIPPELVGPGSDYHIVPPAGPIEGGDTVIGKAPKQDLPTIVHKYYPLPINKNKYPISRRITDIPVIDTKNNVQPVPHSPMDYIKSYPNSHPWDNRLGATLGYTVTVTKTEED